MNKRIKCLAIALAVVTLLVVGVGATVASAAGPTQTSSKAACYGAGAGFRFGGVIVDEVLTKKLGMTEEEIHALREQGQSLVQIAVTKNVTEKQLVDAIMEYKTIQVQARVTEQALTQEQADIMLQRMEQQTYQAVNRTSVGPFGGQSNGYGQQGNCTAAGTCTNTGIGKMNRWAR